MRNLAQRTRTPLVAILVHGGALDVLWLHHSSRVGAILTAWYPGQARSCVCLCVPGPAGGEVAHPRGSTSGQGKPRHTRLFLLPSLTNCNSQVACMCHALQAVPPR